MLGSLPAVAGRRRLLADDDFEDDLEDWDLPDDIVEGEEGGEGGEVGGEVRGMMALCYERTTVGGPWNDALQEEMDACGVLLQMVNDQVFAIKSRLRKG